MSRKPSAIAWFERLYVLGILLATVSLIATWNETMSSGGDDGAILSLMSGVMVALIYVLNFLFWFFIMRRHSNIARWVLSVLTVVTTPLIFLTPDKRPWDVWHAVDIVDMVVGLAAISCLFLPGARRWFDGWRDNLAETFS